MNPGLIGGIVGSLIGIAGGLVGTYYSIVNTSGPRERTFVTRAAVVGWVGVGVFIAMLFGFPEARVFLWIAYGVLLPLGIRYANQRLLAIRGSESKHE